MDIKSAPDPIELTRKLIGLNTINAPGNEKECAHLLANILEKSGFNISFFEFAKNRTSLIAKLDGKPGKLPICFTGHMDTVPLGRKKWEVDPFAGESAHGRLYGRGASDMKAGLAAMTVAAVRLSKLKDVKGGIHLIICASEETGSQGASHIVANCDLSGKVGAIICPEPTSNYPLIGHRGAIWLEASTEGLATHGSSPELGENAIYKAVEAITRLQKIDFQVDAHSILGRPSFNVGTIEGGVIVNEVPDFTNFRIDIRTIPGKTNNEYFEMVRDCLGSHVKVRPLADLQAVLSDPHCETVQMIYHVMEEILGERPQPRGAKFFTDCSILSPACGNPPTVILGPGEIKMAHACDEYCHVNRIEEASEAFFEIGKRWVHG